MKLLVIVFALIAVCNSAPFDSIPGDNSHYVEGVSRYVWIPDGEGVPHLVDLHEPVDQDVLNGRNGANNQYWLFTSLGAHVVGNAGRTAGGRPRRVTGLDPAGPNWGGNSNALNRNAGGYVECIHTDGGLLGIFDPIGDTDFYPNGGRNAQPGCWISTCSHSRAYDLFASTVRTNHLVGRRCNNLNEARNVQCAGATLNMGNGVISKSGSGLYGLRTGDRWPY
ncbi:Lipase member H [Papilio xuthus]|uniref:Lipase member H n=1 Tax=Papilio xuthus TaxID=66420 RepID=A0A194PJI2_PAPXU|nr:Lipase member H [Papilio xuthus]